MVGELIKEVKFPNGGEFSVVIYDLLYEPVDCIVNAANGGLSHGGGVAAAISDAAGPAFDDECAAIVEKYGRIPTGKAVATRSGNLPFKGIIHAVGPRMGDGNEETKIITALYSAFQIADKKGWKSLSFPGISSGLFLVPHDVCARAYIRAVEEFFKRNPDSSLKTIRLCLQYGTLLDAVKEAMNAELFQ